METIQTKINKIKGNYLIRNPHTKGNKKTLPFDVIGYSFNDDYPVTVNTFEYKGKTRKPITAKFTLESVLCIIFGNKKE